MSITSATPVASQAIIRTLTQSGDEQAKSFARLASGQRIIQSGDDPAGLSISENLRAQIRSLGQSERNANDGVSLVQVAEGGLTELSNLMIRLRELGIQAASDTLDDSDRDLIQTEAQSLIQEVDRIAQVTEFNGIHLLNAQAPHEPLEFQVGGHDRSEDRILFDVRAIDARADTLGVDGLDYSSTGNARDTIEKVDAALYKISSSRAVVGATQNRLQTAVNHLGKMREALMGAHSQIADTDIALETSALVKSQILQSVGVSVLAQANSQSRLILNLL